MFAVIVGLNKLTHGKGILNDHLFAIYIIMYTFSCTLLFWDITQNPNKTH